MLSGRRLDLLSPSPDDIDLDDIAADDRRRRRHRVDEADLHGIAGLRNAGKGHRRDNTRERKM